jgi:hypothetical protein
MKKLIGIYFPANLIGKDLGGTKVEESIEVNKMISTETLLRIKVPTMIFRKREIKRRKDIQLKLPAQKNSVDDLVDYWNNKGAPFAKGMLSSGRTKSAKVILKGLYRKHRSYIYSVFDRAHKYFNDPLFDFKFTRNISLVTFLRPTQHERANVNIYNEIGSWWKVFLDWTDEDIQQRFYKQKKDKHPTLTKAILESLGIQNPTVHENNSAINAAMKVIIFCNDNNLNEGTVIKAITDIVKRRKWSVGFLPADKMWKDMLPEELVKTGVFTSRREIIS